MPLHGMRTTWIVWGLVAMLCPAAGCSKKEPRYPEDHARFQRIDAAVESLRTAYVEKNLAAVNDLMLPFEKLERLRMEIKKDFETFQEINVTFSIDRIMIEDDTIDVLVHWQGYWKRAAADLGIRKRGHGMLRWVGTQSILLRDIEGDLPFGMATRLLLSRSESVTAV